MHSIQLRSYVGADGILHLELPIGISDQDLDVMVIYQPLAPDSPDVLLKGTFERRTWEPGFFEATAGSLQDDPIQRWEPGEPENRQPFL